MAKSKTPRKPDGGGRPPGKNDIRPANEEEEEIAHQVESPAEPITAGSVAGRKTVGYQMGINKSLGKKQRQSFDEVRANSAERRAKIDVMLTGLRDQLKKKHKLDGVYSAAESSDLVVGIPMPSLCMEFLLDNDVLPLGIVIQLLGPWGTFKSGFVAEIFRWVDTFEGVNFLINNESKFSPDFFESIMTRERWLRTQVQDATSIDDWQRRLTLSVASMKQSMTGTQAAPGLGATFPVTFVVDSMMGKLTEENQTKIKESGSAGRSHPIEALSITNYLKTIPQELAGWPFLLILVNHLKEKASTSGNGQMERSFGGGKQTGFQETFEIETKISRTKFETKYFHGQHLRLSCMKNSLGTGKRSIDVPVKWWHVTNPETGQNEQVTLFDWDRSTSMTLYALLAGQFSSVYFKNRFKEAGIELGFESPTADFDAKAWCPQLGVPKSDAMSFEDFGKYVSTHPEHTTTLRQLLGIKARAVMEGDFLHQQKTRLEGIS